MSDSAGVHYPADLIYMSYDDLLFDKRTSEMERAWDRLRSDFIERGKTIMALQQCVEDRDGEIRKLNHLIKSLEHELNYRDFYEDRPEDE